MSATTTVNTTGWSKTKLSDMAKLSEQAERFDDMVHFMKSLTERDEGLDADERNLLSIAYKNVVGARRSSWRLLSAVEQKGAEESERKLVLTKEYREKVEKELRKLCEEVLGLLHNSLVPTAKEASTKVFYLKMHGDYCRYLAEITRSDQRATDGSSDRSKKSYKEALDIAKKELPATDPIRLGLVLNFSVFYYEIANEPDEAIALAKDAFEEAMSGLEGCTNDEYKDTTLILQLLRDNLTQWTNADGSDNS